MARNPKKLTPKRLKLINDKRSQRRLKIIVPLIVGLVIAAILHFQIEDFFIRRYGYCTSAVVTEEPDYHRGGPYTYEFIFVVNDEVYYGDSGSSDKNVIGDTIPITYLPWFPRINRSIDTWFEGSFYCHSAE